MALNCGRLVPIALSLKAFGACGIKPEGLAHPLPRSKASVFVAHEIKRPERPTHQSSFRDLKGRQHLFGWVVAI